MDVNGLVDRERALDTGRELASLWRSGQLIPLHDVRWRSTESTQIFQPLDPCMLQRASE